MILSYIKQANDNFSFFSPSMGAPTTHATMMPLIISHVSGSLSCRYIATTSNLLASCAKPIFLKSQYKH
jgi:hypothetical protein